MKIEWQQAIPEDPRIAGFVRCEVDVVERSFPSALAGEKITVHMPGGPVSPGALCLAQPSALLGSVLHDDPAAWGVAHMDCGSNLVAIQRIGFTADVHDYQVVSGMDGWIQLFRSWLDIATGQQVTSVGAKPPQEFHNRTCLFEQDVAGGVNSLYVHRDIALMYKLPEALATTESFRIAAEQAGEGIEVPFAWQLLRDARALHRVAHTRRAVMECGSAAEMANVHLLRANKIDIPDRATLGTTFKLLKKKAPHVWLPVDYQSAFVDVRNREVHMTEGSGSVSEVESKRILDITTDLLEQAFPLPSGLRLWAPRSRGGRS